MHSVGMRIACIIVLLLTNVFGGKKDKIFQALRSFCSRQTTLVAQTRDLANELIASAETYHHAVSLLNKLNDIVPVTEMAGSILARIRLVANNADDANEELMMVLIILDESDHRFPLVLDLHDQWAVLAHDARMAIRANFVSTTTMEPETTEQWMDPPGRPRPPPVTHRGSF